MLHRYVRAKLLLPPKFLFSRSILYASTSISQFSTQYKPAFYNYNSQRPQPMEDLLAIEQMKNFLKKYNLLPKKEPNGLFHICYCPVCNKNREISSQKLYLYPKYNSYSCNNCSDRGLLSNIWETLREPAVDALRESSNDAKSVNSERLLNSLQEIPFDSLKMDSQVSILPNEHISLYKSAYGVFISCLLVDSNNPNEFTGRYFESLADSAVSFSISSTNDFNSKSCGFLFSKKRTTDPNITYGNPQSVIITTNLKTFTHLTSKSSLDVFFIPAGYLPVFNPRELHPYDKIYLWDYHCYQSLQNTMTEVGYVKFLQSNFSSLQLSEIDFDKLSTFFSQVPHPNLFSLQNPTKTANSGWNWDGIWSEFKSQSEVSFPLVSLPSLSKIIKGFRPGELTIFSGPTGCGKTTFLSQLSLDYASQGIKTLWGSFEIKNTRLISKMFRQITTKPIDSLKEQELDILKSQFQSLPMNFMEFFGSTLFEDVLDAMEYSVKTSQIQHIILDNLQFMLSGQDSGAIDKFAIADRVIGQLREFASKRNVHITLVVHPRKEEDGTLLGMNSISGTAKATQEADTVMILQNLDGKGRLIEIKKNRFDGTLGSVSLGFDKNLQMKAKLN